jgi:hypothetical protein
MPFKKLGISTRTVNALDRAGIGTLVELLDKMDEGPDVLLDIKGLGPKSLEEIEETLQQREVYDVLGRELVTPEESAEEEEPEEEEAEETAVPTEEVAIPVEKEPEAEPVSVEAQEEEAPTMEAAEEIPPLAEEEAVPQEEPTAPEPEISEEEAEPQRAPAVPPPVTPPGEELPFADKDAERKKRKTKRLVYDENLGEVVARKVRKPGRRREEWEKAVEDWEGLPEDVERVADNDEEDDSEE